MTFDHGTLAFNETAFREKIEWARDTELYPFYEALIPVLRKGKTRRLLVYTDIEQDLDDLVAVAFLAHMQYLGVVELAGFVANHEPAHLRAKVLRTILHLLNIPDVPAAIGTNGTAGNEQRERFYYELRNLTFINQPWNKKPFSSGQELAEKLARQTQRSAKPLTLLNISSLQDVSDLFDRHEHDQGFLIRNFKTFVSQGGYTVSTDGSVQPQADAANNKFNMAAAKNYTAHLTKLGLPSDTWMKSAATAAALDGNKFQHLRGPLGEHIRWVWRRLEFKFYWDPINAPYMPHLNVEWYLKVRMGLDPNSARYKELLSHPPSFKTAISKARFIPYDGCAAMGALGDDVLKSLGILGDLPAYNKDQHRHRVFGKECSDLGGIDASKMGEVFSAFLFGALETTCKHAEKLIPSRSLEFDVQKYNYTTLHIFKLQLQYLKESKRYEAEGAKAKTLAEKEDYRRKVKDLENAVLTDELGDVVVFKGQPYPKLPPRDSYPYEWLYQEALAL